MEVILSAPPARLGQRSASAPAAVYDDDVDLAMDLELQSEQEELWYEAMHQWIGRILNHPPDDDNVDRLQTECERLWHRVGEHPRWYSWTYHTLAVLSEMSDERGFRYQPRASSWEPVNPDGDFRVVIPHDKFVYAWFPMDLEAKFRSYRVEEVQSQSSDRADRRSIAHCFTFHRATFDRCVDHLRKSLVPDLEDSLL